VIAVLMMNVVVVIVVMMVVVGIARVMCPSSDRSEGDGGGQKHRHENVLHHFSSFEIRHAHGWGGDRLVGLETI
jgi:hypothetical protein